MAVAISAVLTAAYGNADITKSAGGGDEGLACEEFSVGSTNLFASTEQHPVQKAIESSMKARAGLTDGSLLVKAAASPAVTSEQRFETVCQKVRTFFAADPEQAEEAVALAKRMRTEARAAVIATATA